MLTTDQIDHLVDALRQQDALVVDRLAPGLSHDEMDDLTAPLDIRLSDEARTGGAITTGRFRGRAMGRTRQR